MIFFQDVGLDRAAHIGQHPRAQLRRLFSVGVAPVIGFKFIDRLVNGGVHEHRQNGGRRTIDGHGDAGRWAAQIEAVVQDLHIVKGGNRDARVTHLAVDVRS